MEINFDDSFFSELNLLNFNEMITCDGEFEIGVTFAESMGLLPKRGDYHCVKTVNCDGLMKPIKSETDKFRYIYRCNKCYKKISPTQGTWFQKTRLSVLDSLSIVFFWCAQLSNKNTAQSTCVSDKTIIRYRSIMRETVMKIWESDKTKLGGKDKIVEIDESCVFKRKNNVGRLLANQSDKKWIVGGVERGSSNCFLELVEKRDKQTLNQLIQSKVEPGTRIITDCWKGYVDLNSLGYNHQAVNHSVNFVDPSDRTIHTQKIERFWKSVKKNLPKETNKSQRQTYLHEFCFKYKFLNQKSTGEVFKIVLKHIASLYSSPLTGHLFCSSN